MARIVCQLLVFCLINYFELIETEKMSLKVILIRSYTDSQQMFHEIFVDIAPRKSCDSLFQ